MPRDGYRSPSASVPGNSVRGAPSAGSPTTRELYERRSAGRAASPVAPPNVAPTNRAPIEPRYRSSRPVGQPTLGGTAPRGAQPVERGAAAGRAGLTPRYAAPTPGAISPVAANPRSSVRPTTGRVDPTARLQPRTPVTSPNAPRLQPRAGNPTLQPRITPRGVTPVLRNNGFVAGGRFGAGGVTSGLIGQARFGRVWDPWCNWGGWGGYGWGAGWGWGSYWDPWCMSPRWNGGFVGNSIWWGATWGNPWATPWHCGYGNFGFSWSLWAPWWCSQQHYWGLGYGTTWWNTWSAPAAVSGGFWWYPNSTYCPTYLYVPSTVVVEESAAPEPEIEVEPPPAARTEVVVAGSGPAGRVVVREFAPGQLAGKYVELGDFYFSAGRFAEAADAYARARSYAPDDAAVHFVLADAAAATGDYDFAAQLIADGLRLDPGLASADADKRLFYGDIRLFEQQMAALAAHLEKHPLDAKAQLVRGYNLRFSAQPAAARQAFARVLELAPGAEPSQRAARLFLDAMPAADGSAERR